MILFIKLSKSFQLTQPLMFIKTESPKHKNVHTPCDPVRWK